jgi:hypothetical protein
VAPETRRALFTKLYLENSLAVATRRAKELQKN